MHRSRVRVLAAGVLVALLQGCASTPAPLHAADASAQSGGCKSTEVEPTVEMRTDGAPSTASLRGRVSSALTNQPIVDTVVVLSGPPLCGERIVVSDGTGEFRFPNVPPGDGYVLSAENGAYRPYTRAGIRLKPGQRVLISTELIPVDVELPEMSVMPNPPFIDISSSAQKQTLDQDFWRRVPLVR